MARPDGKSVYVTLPADRKTPSFAFAEDGVFLCFQIKRTDFESGILTNTVWFICCVLSGIRWAMSSRIF